MVRMAERYLSVVMLVCQGLDKIETLAKQKEALLDLVRRLPSSDNYDTCAGCMAQRTFAGIHSAYSVLSGES